MKRYLVFYALLIFAMLLTSSVTPFANAQILPIVLQPPSNLSAQAVSTSQINLSWNPPSSLGGLVLTGYEIERSTSGGPWSVIVPNTGNTSTVYSNTGLLSGTTYSYRISAITIILTSSPSNVSSATTFSPITVPQPPTNLAASSASSSQINLIWSAPTNNGGSAITGYKIERSGDSGSTWSNVISNTGSTTTSYSDTGLVANTAYSYRVSAINSVGTSAPSNIATAATNPLIIAPQPPTSLSATAISSSEIDLNWNAPSSDGGSPITNYKIYRSTSSGTETLLTTVGNVISYNDATVTNGQTYFYKVTAINSIGESVPSNEASATPQASGVTVKSVGSNNNPIYGMFTLLCSQGTSTTANGSNTCETGQSRLNSGFTTVTFNAIQGQTFGVDVYNNATCSFNHWSDNAGNRFRLFTATSPPVILTAVYSCGAAPQPPTNLSTTAISSSQINLSWSAPSNNGGSAITGYKIERSNDSGSTWSTIQSNTGSTATTYSDTGLSPSTAYTYRVSAINSIGTSSPSNTVTATTLVQIHSITNVKSGLVVSDSLTNETANKSQLLANQKYWHYGGSATVVNAPYDINKDSQGLHIGIQAPANGTWAGFYAVTPNTNAALFHAIISTTTRTIPGNFYENGLYVQTSTQNVNYVTCFSDTSSSGTVWAIVSATGNTGGATQFKVLWYDPSPNQSLTRDCTIITNGTNYLKVYLDGTMVYTNSTLNLQMPGPFNAFLEPQTSYAGQMLYGAYTNYYATSDENIKVINLPNNAARVDVINSGGTVLATSQMISGSATLDVGKYHFPMAASIKVYDSANNVLASSANMTNMFGGDVYSYN